MGISHVPEGRRIFYTMSVRENILMGNYTHNMNQFKDKLDEVYTLFPRLKERDKQLGGTLSGGRAADVGHRPRTGNRRRYDPFRRAVDGFGAADHS